MLSHNNVSCDTAFFYGFVTTERTGGEYCDESMVRKLSMPTKLNLIWRPSSLTSGAFRNETASKHKFSIHISLISVAAESHLLARGHGAIMQLDDDLRLLGHKICQIEYSSGKFF